MRACTKGKFKNFGCGDIVGLAVYLYLLARCRGSAAEDKNERAALGCIEGDVGGAFYLKAGGKRLAVKGGATLRGRGVTRNIEEAIGVGLAVRGEAVKLGVCGNNGTRGN